MATDRGAAGGALYNHREKDLYHRRESRVLTIVKYILHPYRFLDENMVQTVLVSLRNHIIRVICCISGSGSRWIRNILNSQIRICIRGKSRIRICIKLKSRIRIRIKMKIRIWIRIKVKSRIRIRIKMKSRIGSASK
jgi:hypothetical protein